MSTNPDGSWRGAAWGRSLLEPPRAMLLLASLLVVAVTTQGVRAAPADARPPAVLAMSVAQTRPAPEPEAAGSAASALLTRYGGDLGALRSAGAASLATARNEAMVADLIVRPGIARLNADLERRAALLPSTDADQLAEAVAAIQSISELIHKTLVRAPGQLIVVSLAAQRLVAYDHGRLVLDTPVTTGRPELSTDVGLMHVLRKDAPWTMKSPWPKGSPLWYPDTPVQSVAWFTSTGEGIHDAAWEPLSAYGPGSDRGPFASHGCVHMPPDAQAILFPWVSIGTPVVVIPGDSSPVMMQSAQVSVDQQGKPVAGVRGA